MSGRGSPSRQLQGQDRNFAVRPAEAMAARASSRPARPSREGSRRGPPFGGAQLPLPAFLGPFVQLGVQLLAHRVLGGVSARERLASLPRTETPHVVPV